MNTVAHILTGADFSQKLFKPPKKVRILGQSTNYDLYPQIFTFEKLLVQAEK